MKSLFISILIGLMIGMLMSGAVFVLTENAKLKDGITDEQVQTAEAELRHWISDWEMTLDIYEAYKDSDNPDEQKMADNAKDMCNEIANYYNQLILKNGYLFGETLPEGVYAAIEIISQ